MMISGKYPVSCVERFATTAPGVACTGVGDCTGEVKPFCAAFQYCKPVFAAHCSTEPIPPEPEEDGEPERPAAPIPMVLSGLKSPVAQEMSAALILMHRRHDNLFLQDQPRGVCGLRHIANEVEGLAVAEHAVCGIGRVRVS